MANRRWIVLAAGITALFFIPAAAYAGAGGSPPAPGAAAAGTASGYCCSSWVDAFVGTGKDAVPVLSGTGCVAIDDTAADRVSCNVVPGKAAKCRGEIYTPSGTGTATGTVDRCFSP